MAVSDGRLDLVDRLLAAGADVDATDANGDTALAQAAGDGRLDLIKALLARGASVEAGRSPLLAALLEGQTTAAAALSAAGAVPDDALLEALIRDDRSESLKFLLRHGLDRDHTTSDGTLAELAVKDDADAVLAMLIADHAPLDRALLAAVDQGDTAVVTRLLDAGADPRAARTEADWDRVDVRAGDGPGRADRRGRPGRAPGRRSRKGRPRAGEAPAGPRDRPERHVAPVAARSGASPVEAALLAAGARPPVEWVDQLVWERKWDRLERLRVTGRELDPHWNAIADPQGAGWMVDHGADPQLGLASALEAHAAALVGPLAARGARVDLPDEGGCSPMAHAIRADDDALIDALLAAGASYTADLARYDVSTCHLERLAAHAWTASWRDLRAAAREGGCRAEVKALTRR